MLKRVGMRDEPWGTLQLISVASEQNGGRRTLWVLLVRKEMTQSRALLQIPALLRREQRVWWQTVSNAAERSRRMRAAVSPLSSVVLMSAAVAMRAVLVLWLLRNPDWESREGEQEDRPEVPEVFWVRLGFFEEGVDLGVFPALGEGGGLEGASVVGVR
ncbi:hypothetical protein NDU88_004007 [Pleurodeles waltl]|uniref:Uncharacterized protein n=1 Tax=Pleurodeles waltl TaxID=8319 RepID=A0AAV7UEG5_PLEWA|nr:hypothetical protein NDU88_004007 [Pleurodeles waltl]